MSALKKQPAPLPNENVALKAQIERIKNLLTEKIKNPDIAKKAAMIISEMINKKN